MKVVYIASSNIHAAMLISRIFSTVWKHEKIKKHENHPCCIIIHACCDSWSSYYDLFNSFSMPSCSIPNPYAREIAELWVPRKVFRATGSLVWSARWNFSAEVAHGSTIKEPISHTCGRVHGTLNPARRQSMRYQRATVKCRWIDSWHTKPCDAPQSIDKHHYKWFYV